MSPVLSFIIAYSFIVSAFASNTSSLRRTIHEQIDNYKRELDGSVVCNDLTGFCSVNPKVDPNTLLDAHPDILSNDPPENKKILCPFLRLLERYDLVSSEKEPQYRIEEITRGAQTLGAPRGSVQTVATVTSLGQRSRREARRNFVNFEALHAAVGIAHDCGLNFALGGTTVDDSVRNSTISSLSDLQDGSGRLTYEDLLSVKLSTCEAQDVQMTSPGEIEVGLIWTFLGGNVRGFIETSDVDRFLHTMLPMTIGEPGAML